MKWFENPVVVKVIRAVGMISAAVYLVLSFLDETGRIAVSRAVSHPLFGTFWLCLGITNKSRNFKIFYCILGAVYMLLGLFSLLP